MAQFDVYRLADGVLVVDLQTDLVGLDVTRLVAPLRKADRYVRFPGITPVALIDGESWIVRLPETAAVPGHLLRDPVGSLAAIRDELKRGLDILIDGF